MSKRWIVVSVVACLALVLGIATSVVASPKPTGENRITAHFRLPGTGTCTKCGISLSGDVGKQSTLAVALGLTLCTPCWLQILYGNDFDTILLPVAQLGEDGKVLAEQLPVIQGGAAVWGGITGTLSAQLDLSEALAGKLSANQNITLGGDLSGSGTTSITGTVNGLKGVVLPTLGNGYLYYSGSAFAFQTPAGGSNPAWYGKLYATRANCDPIDQAQRQNMLAVNAPTPTNITISLARCVQFTPPADITVANIRLFGTGATTSLYKFAIYAVGSGTVKLWDSGTVTSVSNAWLNITTGLPITLTAGTKYWWCVTTVSTGTVSGFRSEAAPLGTNFYGADAAPFGGSSLGFPVYAQFAVSSGVFPANLPTIAAAAYAGGTTGSVPFGWLDFGGQK